MLVIGGKQMHTCRTCDHCIHPWETLPFGQCIFFNGYGSKVVKMVDVQADSCPNHTVERLEEQELEATRNRRK